MILLHLLGAILLADFLSGFFHWIEDRYNGDMSTFDVLPGPVSGMTVHHDKPTAMTLDTPWENIRSSVVIAIPVALLLCCVGSPLWLWLGVALSSITNLTHRYAHIPKRQLCWAIRAAQAVGLLISHKQHDLHHRDEHGLVSKTSASRTYCAGTGWLNPILDATHFWAGMEWLAACVGIRTYEGG